MIETYYTNEELLSQGKPIWAIAADPKCPPDLAAKMLQLQKLSSGRKGGMA